MSRGRQRTCKASHGSIGISFFWREGNSEVTIWRYYDNEPMTECQYNDNMAVVDAIENRFFSKNPNLIKHGNTSN